jgi:hypothetical protein
LRRKLIRVARSAVKRDFRARFEIAVGRHPRRRCADPGSLLQAVVTAVEARDHARPAVAGGVWISVLFSPKLRLCLRGEVEIRAVNFG